MALHPQKTKCMVIGSKQKLRGDNHLTLKVNDCILENFGVFIDCNLSWHTHIDFVCKNLNNKISLLKHILYYLTDDMKHMFYNAYLVTIFAVLWGKSNKSYINKVNNVQKRAARLILNKPVRTPTPCLFKQLKWLNFSDRCKYHTSILVYKTLNNMAPSYVSVCHLDIFKTVLSSGYILILLSIENILASLIETCQGWSRMRNVK